MPFPLMKLFIIGLKQSSKHIANAAKNKAKTNARFRSAVVKSAQFYHSLLTKARLDVLGMGKMKKKVEPLTDQQALDLGIEILGDTVIIGCALGIYLLFESRPSFKGSADKTEDLKMEEIRTLKIQQAEQELQLAHIAAELRELERLLHSKTMYSGVSVKVMDEYMKKEQKKKIVMTSGAIY